MSIAYLYDGSFDGLLTAVFEGYQSRVHPDLVAEENGLQVGFGQEIRAIETDDAKARRVEKGIISKLGQEPYATIWTAYLSSDPTKATTIYNYVRRGFEVGYRIQNDLAHPAVLAFDAIRRLVGRETHFTKEFLRFSEMEGGVFYAKITPEHSVVPLVMPHFVDRYSVQPFLIHDLTHGEAGVYDGNGWYLTDTEGMTIPEETYGELTYKRMWKRFYETIAIRERTNPRCRKNHMPVKYWQNMTEFSFVETAKTRAADAKAKGLPALS
jgi:probable DNA metabolism protein